MKLKDASTKVFLRGLFLEEQQGRLVEKKFSFDKLGDVISINKKLLEGSKPHAEDANVIQFSDKEIEFTPAEAAILVDLFDSIKEWPVSKAELALSVKDLLKGK